jgi:hypothetical protein
MDAILDELTRVAARLVVEEGLDYASAKQRAARLLRLGARATLPDNAALEDAVRDYLEAFCGDTQPQELQALRSLAARWMERLVEFRPYLVGAVWQGTATRHSDVCLELFCDDPKMAEIALINQGVRFDAGVATGVRGEPIAALRVQERVAGWPEPVSVQMLIFDADDLRQRARVDGRGRTRRGDLAAVRACLERTDDA